MDKTNIDKVIQDKLQDLDYDYKPEYWDKMENMINASSLSTSSILGSKIFLYTISTAIIIAGGIGSYLIFNTDNEINKKNINTNIAENISIELSDNNTEASNNTKDIAQIADNSTAIMDNSSKTLKLNISDINKSDVLVSSEVNETVNKISDNNNNTQNDNKNIIQEDSICIPCGEKDLNDVDLEMLNDSNFNDVEEKSEEIDEEGVYVVSKLNIKEKADIKNKNETVDTQKIKEEEKIDHSKVKNVKPIRKPSNRVFRKKGKLFKNFGF